MGKVATVLTALLLTLPPATAAAGTRPTTAATGTPPATAAADAPPADRPGWTGTWEAAPSGTAPALPGAAVRNVVHLSTGGSALRVRLSNRYGVTPLRLGTVTVALRGGGAGAVPGTMRTATFHGARTAVLPPGRDLLTDRVRLAVPAAADLLVTVTVPDTGVATFHRSAYQTSYVAVAGAGHAADESGGAYAAALGSWYYVTGVDVRGTARGSVVALGDSLTDGTASTPDTNQRWPDLLAGQRRRLGVLNAGIGGNRLLRDGLGMGSGALARLDADALDRAGVRALVVLEGINDINDVGGTGSRGPDATDPAAYADAYRTLVARAHARGIRVVGVTLTPYRGYPAYTAARERLRQQVNTFIRRSRAFDAVADADAALRDPADPHRLRPRYDPGDHLHFDDAGMAALARVVSGALRGL